MIAPDARAEARRSRKTMRTARAGPQDAGVGDALPGFDSAGVGAAVPTRTHPNDAGEKAADDLDPATLEACTRLMARIAAGDFSEKPPMADGDGPMARFLVAFRFLADDLERAHAERRQEIRRLQEIDQMKTRFINLAAHELNTPLTPIRVQLHLLRSRAAENLNATQRSALDSLDRNIGRLSRSVGDLLDVARMQGRRFTVHPVPSDMVRLASQVTEDFRAPSIAKQIRLELHGPAALPIALDEDRIVQVLYNLVANALQYTPAGGAVTVNVLDVNTHVIVSVTDTGIGMETRHIKHLFQPFAQVHDDRLQHSQGAGLGLFISKGIVEAHHGRIWCESEGVDHGCRFTFLLPKTTEGQAPPVC